MRVAVLMGGTSTERDVSLASGTAVAGSLRECGHDVAEVDLPQSLLDAPPRYTREPGAASAVALAPPPLESLRDLERAAGRATVAARLVDACASADVAFVALHGGFGEDGRIQALLEVAGIAHTGAGHLGCALAFNKPVSKRLMRAAAISTPDWRLGSGDASALDLPLIVKPARGGSTIGVRLVESAAELEPAVEATRRYCPEVLVERFVGGREFTVAVLGGEALPVIEIAGAGAVFDYAAKYQPGAAQEICPAPISAAESDRLRTLACAVHDTLGLGRDAYSRVDFRADAAGDPQCLEANVLPGLTLGSLLPLAARTAGIEHAALCERIVALAAGAAG